MVPTCREIGGNEIKVKQTQPIRCFKDLYIYSYVPGGLCGLDVHRIHSQEEILTEVFKWLIMNRLNLFSLDIFRKRPALPQDSCISVWVFILWSKDILPVTCLLPAHWPWPPWRSRACPGLSSGWDVGRTLCCSWCPWEAKKGIGEVFPLLLKQIKLISPQPIDHEFLLLFAHPHRQQRPYLPQRCQQVDGVLHRGGADGVGFFHGAEQLPDSIILSPQQAEHHPDQLWVLDVRLLSPAGYGLGDQLLQVGCRSSKYCLNTSWDLVYLLFNIPVSNPTPSDCIDIHRNKQKIILLYIYFCQCRKNSWGQRCGWSQGIIPLL